jgi:hypothetical protein
MLVQYSSIILVFNSHMFDASERNWIQELQPSGDEMDNENDLLLSP